MYRGSPQDFPNLRMEPQTRCACMKSHHWRGGCLNSTRQLWWQHRRCELLQLPGWSQLGQRIGCDGIDAKTRSTTGIPQLYLGNGDIRNFTPAAATLVAPHVLFVRRFGSLCIGKLSTTLSATILLSATTTILSATSNFELMVRLRSQPPPVESPQAEFFF